MNEQIIQNMVSIRINHEKSLIFCKNRENDFELFEHEYKFYLAPLIKDIVPYLKKFLKSNEKENLESYLPYILKNWQNFFIAEFKSVPVIGAQFLFKLSESTIKDFNNLLISYEKTNLNLQENFLNKFLETKSKSILILIKNNPELGIKTIANLKSPKLQFLLINKNRLIFKELELFFMNSRRENIYKVISLYFDYPKNIRIETYSKLWIGGNYIHIKFCRDILGKYYEDSKKFMKKKNESS